MDDVEEMMPVVRDGKLGYWYVDRTPEGQGQREWLPDHLEGESEAERLARFEKARRKRRTPYQERIDLHLDAVRWLESHADAAPVLIARCAATSGSGRTCSAKLARVWKTPHGYLLADALIYPFHESRVADLNLAMEIRQLGDPLLAPLAQTAETLAVENLPLPIVTNLSSPTTTFTMPGDPEPRIVFGCAHHGNADVTVRSLLDDAKAAARIGKQRTTRVTPRHQRAA